MAKQYNINITNGQGKENILNDTYNASAEVNGYLNASLTPQSITVVEGTDEYTFTISAEGTLTLHVTEEKTTEGTPIVGATFYRTDSSGNTYGDPIISNEQGNATFNNVPYATNDAPIIYYKQTQSDGNHNFDNTVKSIQLSTQTYTEEIQNTLATQKTIILNDANYENLPITSGTIKLN